MARQSEAAVDRASVGLLVRRDHRGTRVEMGPGAISFGGDQNTKPDSAGRRGHRSGTVGDVPAVLLVVQLNDERWVAARPGAFV